MMTSLDGQKLPAVHEESEEAGGAVRGHSAMSRMTPESDDEVQVLLGIDLCALPSKEGSDCTRGPEGEAIRELGDEIVEDVPSSTDWATMLDEPGEDAREGQLRVALAVPVVVGGEESIKQLIPGVSAREARRPATRGLEPGEELEQAVNVERVLLDEAKTKRGEISVERRGKAAALALGRNEQ